MACLPAGRSSADFSTGSDSPVSADSRTCRSLTSSRRAVRRHKVSRIEPDDVSRNQFRYRQFLLVPITHDRGSRGHLFSDLLHRMPGLELHEEIQQHAEQNDGDDDHSTDPVAQHQRYGAGDEKYDDQTDWRISGEN